MLSAGDTKLRPAGLHLEFNIWEKVDASARGLCTLPLLDHFLQDSEASCGDTGPHSCLVLPVNSIDMSEYRSELPFSSFSSHNIHILLRTDVRPTNVLLRRPFGDHAIEKYFSENPLKIYGEVELPHDGAGKRYPVWATQALPHDIPRDITPMQAELFGAYLVDYGQCMLLSPASQYTGRGFELTTA